MMDMPIAVDYKLQYLCDCVVVMVGSSWANYATVKYDSAGVQKWVSIYNRYPEIIMTILMQ